MMNKSKYAPRPRTSSNIRDVYDVVEALGGANLAQIVKYLPAVNSRMKKRAEIKKALYNAVYRGFLIVDGDGYWRIAPIGYYNGRRIYLQKLEDRAKENKKAKKKPKRGGSRPHPSQVIAHAQEVADNIDARKTKNSERTGLTPPTSPNRRPVFSESFTIRVPKWTLAALGGCVLGSAITALVIFLTASL